MKVRELPETSVPDDNPFQILENIDISNPENGAVVTINSIW